MARDVAAAGDGRGAARWRGRVLFSSGFLLHWLVLFGFWLILSGLFDGFHVTAGLLCSGLVAFVAHELQFIAGRGGRAFHLMAVPWHRLVAYFGWLLREIAIANWQVLRIVLHPRLPIDPALVRFRAAVTSDLGRTMLANSITLTPGTMTVEVAEEEFLIHALVGGEPVVAGVSEMQRRIMAALPAIEGGAERAP